VDGRHPKRRAQRRLGAICGKTGLDEYPRGHTVERRGTIALAGALVGEKEERRVLPDGSAKRCAEDLTFQDGPADVGRFQKWVVGIQGFVAKVFVDRAAGRVAPAACDHLDVSATRSSNAAS